MCPLCSGDLSVRDSKRRQVIESDGSRSHFSLRRLKCNDCGKLHTELPSFMVPHKHYASEVIEAELDGTRDDCHADQSTMNRWKRVFKVQKNWFEGVLRALWSKDRRNHFPLFNKISLLQSIIDKGPGWLAFVHKTVINSGMNSHTQFAFCP